MVDINLVFYQVKSGIVVAGYMVEAAVIYVVLRLLIGG